MSKSNVIHEDNYLSGIRIKIAKIISKSSLITKQDKINIVKKLRESNDSAIYNFLAFGCLNEIKNEIVLRRAKRISQPKIQSLKEQFIVDYNAIRQAELKHANCTEGCKNREVKEARLCAFRCDEEKIRDMILIYTRALGQCTKAKEPERCRDQISKRVEKFKDDLEKAQDKTRQYAATL